MVSDQMWLFGDSRHDSLVDYPVEQKNALAIESER
jgi:hypothetical protein